MDSRPTADDAVRDVPGKARYEITVDGVLAGFMEYQPHRRALVITHTEVNPDFAGQGLAGRLVKAALDDIRANRGLIEPRCPYVSRWIEKHADYASLVNVPTTDPLLEGQQRN